MSATSITFAGRRAAERLMVDTCTVRRVASHTTDPETGVITPTYSTIYAGKCKVQRNPAPTNSRPTSVGEAEVFLAYIELHLPTSATGVDSDDMATIDTSALDPDLVGVVFHLRELAHKTFQTARRFGVQEVTS